MKIPEVLTESGKSQNFRKNQPMCVAYKVIDLDDPNRNDIIDVRCFWPNHSDTCRCVIWIGDARGNRYSYGVGIAGGGGYHHESTAIQDAFASMGITFHDGDGFGGMGEKAQETAIMKVAAGLGYKNILLVKFNP